MSDEKEKEIKPKKKVGRPPTKVHSNVKIDGVCRVPNNSSNIIEISIQDVTLFKNIFTYFKNVKINIIEFDFSEDGLLLKSCDHCNKSELVIVIRGEKLMRYYVKDHIKKFLSREAIEKIFTCIDKTYTSLQIEISKDSQDVLFIKYIDTELERSCTYSVQIANLPQEDIIYTNISKEARSTLLYFKLNTKKFKSFITNAINFTPKMDIIKHPSSPGIQFSYNGHSIISCDEVYDKPDKIELINNIGSSLYRREIQLQIIKPYVCSFTNEYVVIFCQKDTLILSSDLGDDNLATVNVVIK